MFLGWTKISCSVYSFCLSMRCELLLDSVHFALTYCHTLTYTHMCTDVQATLAKEYIYLYMAETRLHKVIYKFVKCCYPTFPFMMATTVTAACIFQEVYTFRMIFTMHHSLHPEHIVRVVHLKQHCFILNVTSPNERYRHGIPSSSS